MIRVLVMIAVAGFLLSIGTLSAAVAIGGPDALSHAAWNWGANHWSFNDRDWDRRWDHRHGREAWAQEDSGPTKTRVMTWTGGDELTVDIPADVRYTQGSGPPIFTVTGPASLVDDLEIRDGHVDLGHDRRHWSGEHLTIVMTAPNVTRFAMQSSGRLAIEGYRQEKLSIDLSGNADVSAAGEVNALALEISGSADADLGKLKAKGAEIQIEGSGEAIVAPTEWAKVDISGSGDVTLLTHPAKLETQVSGSGSIHQEDGASASASPSPSPSPSPGPSKSAKRL